MKKKVEDCTIKELELYAHKTWNIFPSHIDIYWYDVRFVTVEEDVNKVKIPKYFLDKSKEIEI